MLKSKKKIVFSGGSGRFGQVLQKSKFKYKVYFPSKSQLNITNIKSIIKVDFIQIFPDLYDSTGGLNYGRTFSLSGASAATHSHYGYSSIKGGPSKSKGFFRTQVANLPTFGSAELKRMDGYVYIEDVVLDNNSSLTPSIGSFLIKPDSVPDSLATGKLRLQETTRGMGHISAFSSSVDSYISDQETFTGIDSTYSYDSHVEVQAVGRRVFKMSGALYLEVADAYPHARRIDQNGQKVEDYGHDFKKFSELYKKEGYEKAMKKKLQKEYDADYKIYQAKRDAYNAKKKEEQ